MFMKIGRRNAGQKGAGAAASFRVQPLITVLLLLFCAVMPFSATANPGPEDVKIAVFPFEINAGPELEYLEENLSRILNERLSALGFRVTDPAVVDSLLAEHQVEYLNIETVKDLTLLAGAGYGLYGSLSLAGETLSLDARLVEAFGLAPVKPVFVVKEGVINLFPAVDELVEKVRKELFKQEVIAEVKVEGTHFLDEDVILMRLKMQPGDVFDPAAINKEMKRVYELGYFEDVKVKVEDAPEGKVVVFDVEEKPRILAVGVLGAEAKDADDIIAVMNTKTGGVLNPKILAEDLNKVRELYVKDGYYLVEVSYELEEAQEGQARLNIVVNEGRKLYIQKITIQGAEAIDEDELKDQLALSERGFLSFITGSGVLKQELLERDAVALEAYYANRGFMDAKVGRPEVEYTEEGINVIMKVREGDRYKTGDVNIRGDLLASEGELFDLMQMDDLKQEGAYFDRSILRNDAQALTDYYHEYGYAYAEADYSIDKNEDDKTIDVVYRLSKNQKVYIRRVVIEGNTKTRDNVIRREMRLGDGDLFSGSKLKRSYQRLNKTNFFESVDIETVPASNPEEMDLRVKVKEKSTGMLSGGVGYSSYERIYLTVKLMEHNLFGKGYYLGLTGTFSGKTTRYNLGFTNPALYDTELSTGFDAYYDVTEYSDFDKDTIGGRVRFSYPLGEYTKLYWNYRLDNYEIKDVEDDAASEIKDIEGENWSSVLYVAASRDSTDRYFNPTDGTINTVSMEWGGGPLQGDDHFIKLKYDSSFYYPLIKDWGHVFHWHGQVGYVFDIVEDDEVPVFERFYLGGMNNIRGYPGRHIAPRDEETGDYIGGNSEMFMNFEYLFPLEKEFGLMGLAFFDIGNAWGEEDDIELDDLKKSIGVGVRWYSPFGPLRLEYGYALDDVHDQGSHHKIEFSMGQFF